MVFIIIGDWLVPVAAGLLVKRPAFLNADQAQRFPTQIHVSESLEGGANATLDPVKAELGAEQSMRIGWLVGDELPPTQSRTGSGTSFFFFSFFFFSLAYSRGLSGPLARPS